MFYSRQVVAKKLSFIVAPLVLCPLLFFGREYKCLYVIFVMCTYWITKCVPMGITSLVPLFLFPVLQIMGAKDVSRTYFMDTTILGIASLLMGNAVGEVNLHKRIALGMLHFVGYRKQFLLIGTIFLTGFVSMWVADMAACVMMLPIIIAILKTLQDVQKQSLSSSESSSDSSTSKETSSELNLETMSKADRGFSKALIMSCATASLFGGKGTLTGSTPNIVFREQFGPEETVSYLQWASFSIPFMIIGLICNYLVLTAVFILPTILDKDKMKLSSNQKATLRRLTKKKIQEEYDTLGPFSFAEASVMCWFAILIILWMTRNPGFTPGWGRLLGNNGKNVTDGTSAVLIAIIMFIWPKNPKNDKSLEPILTWNVMKTKFSWQCVLLVAVGNAISEGVKASGLSQMIGCLLRDVFTNLQPFWLQVFAQLAASIVSEFTSNTSTAGIFVPIMLSIGQAFHINPLYLVLPATFASSYGFMMPMACPVNSIVYDTGVLTIWEMSVAGFFLKIAAIAITAVNFETLAYTILKLDQPLPFQTANTTSINC